MAGFDEYSSLSYRKLIKFTCGLLNVRYCQLCMERNHRNYTLKGYASGKGFIVGVQNDFWQRCI